MSMLPVLKKQSKDYSFQVTSHLNEKPICTYFVYLNEQVLIMWHHNNKSWEYHAIREDGEFGLMTWVNPDGTWKKVNEDIGKAYSDFVAEKALLKD